MSREKKAQDFNKDPQVAQFKESIETNERLEGLKEVIESKDMEVNVEVPDTTEALENINESLRLLIDESNEEQNFDGLKEGLSKIVATIQAQEAVDTSGIEQLLQSILSKEEKDIDLSELENVSGVLGLILGAINGQSTPDNKPTLEQIQVVLNAINDNIVDIDIPDFDYKRLAKVIKDNVKISVASGGGGGGINKHLLDSDGNVINPSEGLGEGADIDRVDSDGTEGTTKGTLMMGVGTGNKASPVEVKGGSFQTVDFTDRQIQEDILIELKVISIKLDVLQPRGGPAGLDELGKLR